MITKTLHTIGVILIFNICTYGQVLNRTKNGSKKLLTLTEGKYEETFEFDTLVRVGSVVINPTTGKLIGFSTNEDIQDLNEVAVSGRFLSLDPLAEEYTSISPYAYVANNPVRYIDPDGRIIVDGANQIIATKTTGLSNEVVTVYETDAVVNAEGQIVRKSLKAEFEYFHIYANDGTPIIARRLIRTYTQDIVYKDQDGVLVPTPVGEEDGFGEYEGKYDCRSNCHGLTFVDERLRITDDEVLKIIAGDGYIRTTEDDADVVLFYSKNDQSSTTPNHSAERNRPYNTYNSNDSFDISLYNTPLNGSKPDQSDGARRGPNTDPKRDQFYKKGQQNRIYNTQKGDVQGGVRMIRDQNDANEVKKEIESVSKKNK